MIYAIGDLHLDSRGEKPMDIFGDNWTKHDNQIFLNWEKITDEDLVLIPGDISWATKLIDAIDDLNRIDSLPGKKVLIKGNHDYWWSSMNKLQNLELKSLYFINNCSYNFNGVSIGGSRGWIGRDNREFNVEEDEKIYRRELLRVDHSLETMDSGSKKICLIHYPPFNQDHTPNEFAEIMKKHSVDICIYGHLHGKGHEHIVEGNIDGIEYICASADYIDFDPKLIEV